MTHAQFTQLREKYLKDQKAKMAEFAIPIAWLRSSGDPELFSKLLPEVEAENMAQWNLRAPQMGPASFLAGDYEQFLIDTNEPRTEAVIIDLDEAC